MLEELFFDLPLSLNIVLVFVALYAVTRSSHYMVDGAVNIAHEFNISPLVIGATVVAVGTSAAELAINMAVVLGGGDTLAVVGNILGSNLVNFGIGLGVPGLVNTRKGELLFAPNLGWQNVPLRLMWNQRFHLPLYVENEANLAALGEYYFGVGREVDNLIYLSSGVGLGGGLIINGKLFKGGYGLAGEIGHIQRDPAGEMCGCGRRGCWETQVGPRAVLQRVKRSIESDPDNAFKEHFHGDLDKLTFNQVVDCALQGSQLCRSALEEVGKNLGTGIADLANIFNPEMVIIGGGVSKMGELLLKPARKVVIQKVFKLPAGTVRIVRSRLGDNAGILGAAIYVFETC